MSRRRVVRVLALAAINAITGAAGPGGGKSRSTDRAAAASEPVPA